MSAISPTLEGCYDMVSEQSDRPTPLAKWLDNALKSRGWSQRRLAEEAGISQPRITQILAGESPRRATVVILAEALYHGVSDGQDRYVSEALTAAGYLTDPADMPGMPAGFELPQIWRDNPGDLREFLNKFEGVSDEAKIRAMRASAQVVEAILQVDRERQEKQ